LTLKHSWPAARDKASAHHNNTFFGAITFTIWFRLEYFTIYASSLLLPPATQDSLYGDAGTPSATGLSPARYTLLFPAHATIRVKTPMEWKYGIFLSLFVQLS
jgi:hypothetical protein